NALWSLGVHDLSVILWLIDEEPVEAVAHGRDFLQPGVEDVVFCFLRFPSSQDRCMCATLPEGKRRKQKTTSSTPGWRKSRPWATASTGSSSISQRMTERSWTPSDQSAFSCERITPRFWRLPYTQSTSPSSPESISSFSLRTPGW